jgi:hypothetical protein
VNTGVYVFTCVNASGIRQLREKQPVRGYRRGNQGCCGVNVLKAKDRCWNRHRGRADARVASAAVAVKGQARCATGKERPPLTTVLAAASWQL